MDEITVMATVLGILGTVCAIAFGLASYKRNRRADDADDGKESGTMLTEIGYIKAGVDDIKRKQEQQDIRHLEVIGRLTAVEASSKQAHKRIDRIEDISSRDN